MTTRPSAHNFGPLDPEKAADRAVRLWARLPDRARYLIQSIVREIQEGEAELLRRVPENRRAEARRLISAKLQSFEPEQLTIAVPPEKTG